MAPSTFNLTPTMDMFNSSGYTNSIDIQRRLPLYAEIVLATMGIVPSGHNTNLALKPHQWIGSNYFFWSDVDAILFNHGTGSGKTFVLENIGRMTIESGDQTSVNRIIVMCRSSGHINDLKDTFGRISPDRYGVNETKSTRSVKTMRNRRIAKDYEFVTYLGWCRQVIDAVLDEYGDTSYTSMASYLIENYSNTLFLLDELHNATIKDKFDELLDYNLDIRQLKYKASTSLESDGSVNNMTVLRMLLYVRDYTEHTQIAIADATVAVGNVESFRSHAFLLLNRSARMQFAREDLGSISVEKFNRYFHGLISRAQSLTTKAEMFLAEPVTKEEVNILIQDDPDYPGGSEYNAGEEQVVIEYYACQMSEYQEWYSKRFLHDPAPFHRSSIIAGLCVPIPEDSEMHILDFYARYVHSSGGYFELDRRFVDYLTSQDHKAPELARQNNPRARSITRDMITLAEMELRLSQLEYISTEFAAAIRVLNDDYLFINNGESSVPIGVVSCYCPYVTDTGAVVFGLIIEVILGWERYNNNDTQVYRDESGKTHLSGNLTKKWRYAILTNLTNPGVINSAKSVLMSDDNVTGEYIRLVIYSKLASEGMNINNVLEHIELGPIWRPGEREQSQGRSMREDSADALISFIENMSIATGEDIASKYISPEGKLRIKLFRLAAVYESPEEQSIDVVVAAHVQRKKHRIDHIQALIDSTAVDAICNRSRNVDTAEPMFQPLDEPIIMDNLIEQMGNRMLYGIDSLFDRFVTPFASVTEIVDACCNEIGMWGDEISALIVSSLQEYVDKSPITMDMYGRSYRHMIIGDYLTVGHSTIDYSSKYNVIMAKQNNKVVVSSSYPTGHLRSLFGSVINDDDLLAKLHSLPNAINIVSYAIEVAYKRDQHDPDDVKTADDILRAVNMSVVKTYYPISVVAHYTQEMQRSRVSGGRVKDIVSTKDYYQDKIVHDYSRKIVINNFAAIPSSNAPNLNNILSHPNFTVYFPDSDSWKKVDPETDPAEYMAMVSMIMLHYSEYINLENMNIIHKGKQYPIYAIRIGRGDFKLVNITSGNKHNTGSTSIDLSDREVYEFVINYVYPEDKYSDARAIQLMRDTKGTFKKLMYKLIADKRAIYF